MVGLYIQWYQKINENEQNIEYRIIFDVNQIEKLIHCAEIKECEHALLFLEKIKNFAEELN